MWGFLSRCCEPGLEYSRQFRDCIRSGQSLLVMCLGDLRGRFISPLPDYLALRSSRVCSRLPRRRDRSRSPQRSGRSRSPRRDGRSRSPWMRGGGSPLSRLGRSTANTASRSPRRPTPYRDFDRVNPIPPRRADESPRRAEEILRSPRRADETLRSPRRVDVIVDETKLAKLRRDALETLRSTSQSIRDSLGPTLPTRRADDSRTDGRSRHRVDDSSPRLVDDKPPTRANDNLRLSRGGVESSSRQRTGDSPRRHDIES